MALVTELTELKMDDKTRKWRAKAFGSFFAGSTRDRAIRITAGKLMYCGIKDPLYSINGGTGNLTITETDIGNPDSVMQGKVRCVEVYYRELTNERSLSGAQTLELDMTDKCKLEIESNSVADASDLYISHREFYLNYTDSLGVYYLAERIPYTGGADSVTVNVAPSVIVTNRPLEDQKQTSLYPAVKTACFWRSRIFGAVLEPRDLEDGASIKLTEGSNIAEITGDEFIESDIYHGIVDRSSNQIYAYIDRIIDSTHARIIPSGSTDLNPVWKEPDITLTDVGLSGDESMIYASPIYVGEAGGGLTYGLLTWNPLDQLRDEGFYSSGAKIAKVVAAGEELCVIYDRGIAFYQGDISVDAPPAIRQYVAAENVGALQPDEVWKTPDGRIWFKANGRLFCIANGRAIDIAHNMSNANFFNKWVAFDANALNLYQASFNPTHDHALLVTLPKKGDTPEQLGTWGVVIDHGTQTLHPVRFPVRFTSIHCVKHDDGEWQYYGGTDLGTVYKVMVRGKHMDDIWDEFGNPVNNIKIPVDWIGGVDWLGGNVYTDSVRFLIDSEETSGIELTLEVDLKKSNINTATFSQFPEVVKTIPFTDLNRAEFVKINRDHAYGIQYRVKSETDRPMTLVTLSVVEDLQYERGRS